MKQTTRQNLKDLVENLGGVTDGRSKSEVLDDLEGIAIGGGGATPEQLDAAVERYVETHHGGLTDSDFDDIFGE